MIPPLYDGDSGALVQACVILFQPHDRRPHWAERWLDALTHVAQLVEIASLNELAEFDEPDEMVSCIVVHADDFDAYLQQRRASDYLPVRLGTYPLVVIHPEAVVADAVHFAQHGAVEVVSGRGWFTADATVLHSVGAALNADLAQFPQRRQLRKLLRRFSMLTPRQQEVVMLLGRGLDAEEIARQCGIQPRTVAEHRRAARQLLGARNLAELVRLSVMIVEAVRELDDRSE